MSVLTSAKGKLERVTLSWGGIADSIVAAGTPIGADGQVHNDGQALGILVRTVSYPWDGTAEILTAGYVDREEAERLSSITLTNEAQAALHDVKLDTNGKINSMVAVAG